MTISSLDSLLSPTEFGRIKLKNRIIMAPMTRSRAGEGDAPTQLHVDYYSQRASAGLIITEGTQPSEDGKGYCRTPGIHSEQQIEAWKKVTQAVSDKGGQMVMQIMHVGRVSSRHNKSANAETVAPSAIQCQGQIYTDSHGMADYDVPRELGEAEIQKIIFEYRNAAQNAIDAGFAGVELHATSGYLPAQFLSTGTNQRVDKYGGSLENRLRFTLEVLSEMSAQIGADRVGVRICPGNPFNDLQDDNPGETFAALLDAISPMDLAYLHVIRMPFKVTGVDNLGLAKQHFSGPLIFNDSYTAARANTAIESEGAAAVSFGRDFIANPDLVERIASGMELAKFDTHTLYTPEAQGYSDYPPIE